MAWQEKSLPVPTIARCFYHPSLGSTTNYRMLVWTHIGAHMNSQNIHLKTNWSCKGMKKQQSVIYFLFFPFVPSCGLMTLHLAGPCQALSLSSMDSPGWLEMALGAQHGTGPGCMVVESLSYIYIYMNIFDFKNKYSYNAHPVPSWSMCMYIHNCSMGLSARVGKWEGGSNGFKPCRPLHLWRRTPWSVDLWLYDHWTKAVPPMFKWQSQGKQIHQDPQLQW